MLTLYKCVLSFEYFMSQEDYITASEIAEYVYCNRAWWLKVSGYQSENQEALSQGSATHIQYAQHVRAVTRLERAGRFILLLGISLLIVFFLLRLFIR